MTDADDVRVTRHPAGMRIVVSIDWRIPPRMLTVRTAVTVNPLVAPPATVGILEPEAIAHLDRSGHFDEEVPAVEADDGAERLAAIVRLRSRDVVASGAAAVHAAGESAAVDLNERLNFFRCRRNPRRGQARSIGVLGRFAETIQPFAIRLGDGGDVLGLLLSAFDLEALDSRLGDRREVVVARRGRAPR